MIGTTIAGKYLIKRRIGSGGMGAVYEGEHVEIGKRVAIKVIEHEHARSAELAARFRREARAASAVESEHIVQVFDVGQDEAIGLYMVMELLVGEDLASRLEKAGGKIPVEEAVTIATQAARALGKAHAAGVVHRDLKPANLFLTTREDGSVSVKVLDFGISKLVRPEHDAKSSNLTREGSVMGTPMYMSPEQAQGLPVDARSDVWSLASVLYEAIAGRTAYDARDTYEQMIVQIVTQKPRPIEEVAPWVPAAIARVIESALAHDIAMRIPDATSFAKKLAEAAHMPATASDPDLTLLAPAPSSDGRVVVRASTGAASPPTGTGVVVGARTELEAGAAAQARPRSVAGPRRCSRRRGDRRRGRDAYAGGEAVDAGRPRGDDRRALRVAQRVGITERVGRGHVDDAPPTARRHEPRQRRDRRDERRRTVGRDGIVCAEGDGDCDDGRRRAHHGPPRLRPCSHGHPDEGRHHPVRSGRRVDGVLR